MLLFASAAHSSGTHPLVTVLIVILGVFVFLKFCGWAKNFKLTAATKKTVFILTGVGLVGFNVAYALGNKAIEQTGNWSLATTALLGSLVWVFIFAFALMSETK